MTAPVPPPLTLEEIVEEFEFLGDWESRCDYLIDLGMELPGLPDEAKIETNRVHGCQSLVWLVFRREESRVVINADSDAMIVRGLIAVLLATFSGKSPSEIQQIDAQQVFRQLELDRHLSSARKNGLWGMVKRIHEYAANGVGSDE